MFELAMANGLVSINNVPKPHAVVAATEDGKQVPFTILQEIYEAYICFLRRCEEYFLCQYIPPPDIYSVGEHINLETEIFLDNVNDTKEKHLKHLIFQCLLKRETCISGCNNMNDIDLLELGSFTELQGGNIILPGGYSSILQPISQHIPSESIVLSCPVKTIRWRFKKNSEKYITNNDDDDDPCDSDDSDKTVTEVPINDGGNSSAKNLIDKNCSSGVVVICEDGNQYYADHVICTVPLGVLKESSNTLFEPSLPQYKLESIDRLLFGTVNKIFLEYERPFLNSDISEIMLLWETTDCDYEMTNAASSSTSSSSSSKKNVESIEQNWYKKIYSFSKINDTLLLGWLSGREAEYMETLSNDVVANVCTDILRKFLKDPYVPKPKQCICTKWRKQKYCRGSYTAIAVGASQEDIEYLAQPLYASPLHSKPVVLFAGEHTHTNFYSTVHGAYLSGRTAAQILSTPDSPQEIIMESDSSDLSSWIQGIAIE